MSSWNSTIRIVFSFKMLLYSFVIAFLYASAAILLLNHQFVSNTLMGHYSFFYKFTIIQTLIIGSWQVLPPRESFLLFLNSILVGINFVLAIKTIYLLEHTGKIRVSLGGASILGLLTTGCSSCGFSLLSLLGLSASLSFLPFHGLELHIGAIVLLFFSFFYMLFQLHKAEVCKLPKRK